MKNQQKEEAQNLYFQTDMSKSEIAEKVGVNRKTILFWSQQNNWDKLRKSARNMPSLVAEKCYYLIDQYASHLLVDGTPMRNFSLKDAQVLHLLATTIKKLKNRNTLNESMEMFNFFLDRLNQRNPGMAEQIAPHIEEYITARRGVESNDFLLDEFNKDGSLPYPEKQQMEKFADEKEYEELVDEFEQFMKTRQPKPNPQTNTTADDPQPSAPQPDNNELSIKNNGTHLNQAA